MASTGQSKYILGERIAQGGMAEIYLGKVVGAEGFTRICAFKKILPHFAEDGDFVQMFKNEAMLAKQLQNKNIVQVYDFVSEDGESPMLVMEFVDGQDLRSILREVERNRIKIPLELSVYVAAEILAGLSYAHTTVDVTGKSLGIIHRDISPQNIMVSFEGDVKLTDFGIAKVQSTASVTRAGVLKGKFRYMAPEQALGQQIDARCDIFAVGIVLYEMLTMTRLFKGDDDFQILQAVRDCKIRQPNDIKGISIPTELESIVLKLLQKDAKARFQTARDAAKELTRFLYSLRKDFFPGELADFMQKLFSTRIEEAREKVRTTLALPVEAIRPSSLFGYGKNYPPNIPEIPNKLPNNFPKDQVWPRSDPDSVPFLQKSPGYGNQHFEPEEKISLAPTPAAQPVSVQKSDTKIELNQVKRQDMGQNLASKNIRRTVKLKAATRVDYRPQKKSFPWEKVLISFCVALVVSIFGFTYALKKKILVFRSNLELRANIPSQKKVKIKINGVPYNDGKAIDLPYQFSFESGTYTIAITKPGFAEQRITFTAPLLGMADFGVTKTENILLQKGETSLCNLLILTEPKKDAHIDIDDEFTGVSGKPIEFVPVGRKYKIKIEHPSCSPYIGEIDIPITSAERLFSKQITLPNCGK